MLNHKYRRKRKNGNQKNFKKNIEKILENLKHFVYICLKKIIRNYIETNKKKRPPLKKL